MAVTSLDGRAFRKFVAAGTWFLRKHRSALDELNVFPVPDGDTGSNMYLTASAALSEVRAVRARSLAVAAAAAARGSLLGARGNSGAILAQMFCGFARAVRDRDASETVHLAAALEEAAGAARAALAQPLEGTIVSVAQAAADEARRLALEETEIPRWAGGIVRAAKDALERTPEQLSALRDAGVVDAGGAGLCVFLEGVLRFLPDTTGGASVFPRRPLRPAAFTDRRPVGEHRFCTEFILEEATLDVRPLRDLLAPLGDSLVVAGTVPTVKVHLHTRTPGAVQALAARYGRLTRVKIDDMARQHQLLVVERRPKPFGIAAVVPGEGFARIARELGADATITLRCGEALSPEELLAGVNATGAERVYLLANDPNVAVRARDVGALTAKTLTVVPTRDVVRGLAVQLALAGRDRPPEGEALDDAAAAVGTATVFFAPADGWANGLPLRRGAPTAAIDGRLCGGSSIAAVIHRSVRDLGGEGGGLVTLYYGGRQREGDAQRHAVELGECFAAVSVEYYYGGQPEIEYWIALER